ncbi:hypothetical protein EIK77_003323 [Talaromyces pinophilus]|nr:hypothetical protein EIK77_003323 [Talaromyces pinophilus]
MSTSYIAFDGPGGNQTAWSRLFRNFSFLEAYRTYGFYFSLIGDLSDPDDPWTVSDTRHIALIVASDIDMPFSLETFRRSLQPHSYRNGELVIKFTHQPVELNISHVYGRFRGDIVLPDPAQLVAEYYKSGTILMFATSMTTYGLSPPEPTGALSPGPIERSEEYEGYTIKYAIARRPHQVKIRRVSSRNMYATDRFETP